MTAQEYINSELERLKKSAGLSVPNDAQLENEIARLILYKKFRKYSANKAAIDHIRNTVHLAVSRNEPIKFVFPHGGYKLWRLDEAPVADFAELFTFMYYTDWLKPICEVYNPGVWFEFFVDDLILLKMNNLERSEIEEYCKSEQELLDFIKQYQPTNIKMTMTRCSSLFNSEKNFWNALDDAVLKMPMSALDEETRARIKRNVRPVDNMPYDWCEKNWHLHCAYFSLPQTVAYLDDNIETIKESMIGGWHPTAITTGSTKNSIMKFWVGVGVLKPKYDSFEMAILSENQLAKTKFRFEPIKIKGLGHKNFSRIRIIE